MLKYIDDKKTILEICPTANEMSGIYVLTREENGIKFGYVGQAKRILTRLAQHLNGYQHIDLSIKKHGFYCEDNQNGWRIRCFYCDESELDINERKSISFYANKGYQLRNKTDGGQGKGKAGLSPNKPAKGYYDGLKQGYKNAQKEVSKLFEKNLLAVTNGKLNKNKEKAFQKFNDFLLETNKGEV